MEAESGEALAPGMTHPVEEARAATARSPIPQDAPATAKHVELTLDALKAALNPGEHRLFRWGKLAGLFPSRAGASGEAATAAVRDGLLTVTRTETKGKLIVEWVRVTPAGVEYVHDRDSPKAVLRELKAVLGETRAGVPAWMAGAKAEVAAAAAAFEGRAAELLARLDALATRVEDALRRAEAAAPPVSSGLAAVVPWGVAALEYLDRRAAAGAKGDCPLPELFHALPGLTLPEFQDGLRRLADGRAIRLTGGDPASLAEPEFAFVAGGTLVCGVSR